jgi:hypothetical protein
MAYNATQLIASSYYAAGVVSREFETVSGTQKADGLQWLNEILAEKRIDDGMIPYLTTYTFNAESGVEKYFIPNLIKVDTLTFFINSVRYSLRSDKKMNYFGSSRIETISSLPYKWHFERQTGGGNLYIYFKPDRNYPMEVHGVFDLNSVTEFQDLMAIESKADLGVSTVAGTGELAPGQLVVNDVDLAGTYATINDLVNYINTGVVPGVTASLSVNNFILKSETQPPVPIYVRTAGADAPTNYITFANFSTIGSPLYKIYNPSGFDQFYTTYLKYALADRICAEYNYTTPVNVSRQLDKYRAWINKKSNKLDLSMQKVSTLNKRRYGWWGYANLGRGFVP